MIPLPIETQRLGIRAPARKDMDTWVSLYTDPSVLTHMGHAVDRSADEWWARLYGNFESVDLPLSVAGLLTDRCIGQAGYLKIQNDQDSLEIYCRLLTEAWGKGYGREICGALTTTAFSKLGVAKVMGYVHPENKASISLLSHLGFVYAGQLASSGGWQDGHDIYEKKSG